MLNGDIFPKLLTEYATIIGGPAAEVFNAAYREQCWPEVWKTERVSCIPKTKNPSSLTELRYISCTPVLSKIMEYFVLDKLRGEVLTKTNQFGGIPGLGTNHYLIEAWDKMLESLDDYDAACALISIDFAKAFNTMGHQTFLHQLELHGASTNSYNLVQAFLTGRKMEFKVNESFSAKRLLKGGSPQGTLLGNFLFILATDSLEEAAPDEMNNDHVNETLLAAHYDVLPLTPIRRRPSVLSVNFETAITSSPVVDNDPPLWGDDGGDDSFEYFRPLCSPYNQISDTRLTRTIYTMSASAMEREMLPSNDWTYRPFKTIKYVDDFLGAEKISTQCSYSIFTTKRTEKFLPASGCQHFFENVKRNASNIGTSVNPQKMQLLRRQARISCFIYSDESRQMKILCQETMKMLGFTFGSAPNATAHIDSLMNKFRRRIWLLRHLGQATVH